jgi:hypothetical protein
MVEDSSVIPSRVSWLDDMVKCSALKVKMPDKLFAGEQSRFSYGKEVHKGGI